MQRVLASLPSVCACATDNIIIDEALARSHRQPANHLAIQPNQPANGRKGRKAARTDCRNVRPRSRSPRLLELLFKEYKNDH